MADIYLNSSFIGKTDNAETFVENVKDLRRKGDLPEDVNVYYNNEAD